MKKNILLVQSLLTLVLLPSSLLFCAERTPAINIPVGTRLPQDAITYPLKNSGSHKRSKKKKNTTAKSQFTQNRQSQEIDNPNIVIEVGIPTQTIDNPAATLETETLVADSTTLVQETKALDQKNIENIAAALLSLSKAELQKMVSTLPVLQDLVEKKIETPAAPVVVEKAIETEQPVLPESPIAMAEELFMSVRPTEKEVVLSYADQIKTSMGYFIQPTINFLNANNPSIIGTTYFADLFNKAIAQAIETKDLTSFTNLVKLSHDKPVRMSDEVAPKALAFLHEQLKKQAENSQKKIDQINAQSQSTYNATAQAFRAAIMVHAQSFDTNVAKMSDDSTKAILTELQYLAHIQTTMAELAILNRVIRKEATNISEQNFVKSKNILAGEKEAAQKRTQSILNRSNNTPLFDLEKKQNLQLTEK